MLFPPLREELTVCGSVIIFLMVKPNYILASDRGKKKSLVLW